MKVAKDFIVIDNIRDNESYSHLVLRELCSDLSEKRIDYMSIRPGQFVEVRIDGSKDTFLRRPISLNLVIPDKKEIHLLIRNAGAGTKTLCNCAKGEILNLLLPLGNGFTMPQKLTKPLLIGGGVGVAPLLHLGTVLKDNGVSPSFLLAARSIGGLLELDDFKAIGNVFLSTDDGSAGYPGLVSEHPVLKESWEFFYCCGPMPMMKAIGKIALNRGIPCEVSLENSMACGIGACLCCVEDTVDGNVCVCKDGPVFNVTRLKWWPEFDSGHHVHQC